MRGTIAALSVCCIISVMLVVFPVEGAKFGGTPSGIDLVIESVNSVAFWALVDSMLRPVFRAEKKRPIAG